MEAAIDERGTGERNPLQIKIIQVNLWRLARRGAGDGQTVRGRRRTDGAARARPQGGLAPCIREYEGTGIKPILVVEIVSALMGPACLAALCAGALRFRARARSMKRHRMRGVALLIAGGVHGVAASAYASGAHPLAYACGWASLAALAACGASALPSVHAKAPRAVRWHVPLFVVGVALFAAHAVLGRM